MGLTPTFTVGVRFAGLVGQEVPVFVALEASPVGDRTAPLAHDHWGAAGSR
jgi:hypothetical protein